MLMIQLAPQKKHYFSNQIFIRSIWMLDHVIIKLILDYLMHNEVQHDNSEERTLLL